MKCLQPRTIRYEKLIMHVDCGKCEFCIQNKRKDWMFRIMQEEKVSDSSHFITLTYNDENIPITDTSYTLAKADIQSYFKKLRIIKAPKTDLKNYKRAIPALNRKNVKKYVPKSKIRYFVCGEYGEKNQRPHYHGIIFNSNPQAIQYAWSNYSRKHDTHIPMGHTDIQPVNSARIAYVTKYMINKNSEKYENIEKPFNLMSRGNGETKGIGYGYIKKGIKYHRGLEDTQVILPGGTKIGLPKYYKNKMFTSNERMKMYDKFLQLSWEKEKESMEKIGVKKHEYLEKMRIITRINRIKKSSKQKDL